MNKHICQFVAAAAVATLGAGCIKNDIPYPHIQANFITIEAVGQDRGASIDTVNRAVTFYLPEEVDIENVRIGEYTLTEGAEIVGGKFDAPLNLSKPDSVVLHLYYDYVWTLSARQTIERYFTVNGQIGASVIDEAAHTVSVEVGEGVDLTSVEVLTAKLGAPGAVYSPVLQGAHLDLSSPLTVDVTEYGRTTRWTISATVTIAPVSTTGVDAWTQVAWVHGSVEAGRSAGVQFRIKGDSDWTVAPDNWVTVAGGTITGRLIHLSPLTTYEARAFSGDDFGEIVEFTTGSAVQVPNSDFDSWWLDGKVWCPWPEGGEQVWDTGNKGATTLGSSNSVPTDDTVSGMGQAAMLETRFVGIGPLGKLAAGNIFVGRYVRTDGTNGVLSFGHEFADRPTKLKGYLKYKCSDINYASAGFESLKGQPDTCIVWVALIDSDEPFEIRTNPKNRQLFDPEGDYVVAYGKIEFGENVDNYTPFEFELNYTSTGRKPKYILMTASASKYGDYFTGGSGSTLLVDDFELVYDY